MRTKDRQTMPSGFFVFDGESQNDEHQSFRREIWERGRVWNSTNKEPTRFKDFDEFLPKSLIPSLHRASSFDTVRFDFEMAKKTIKFFAYLKLNRSTLEKGKEKNNGSTSSSHRRIYFSNIHQVKDFARSFFPDDGSKIQVEKGRSLRAHLNRKGRGNNGSYLIETTWEKKIGPMWIQQNGYSIPVGDEEYLQKILVLPEFQGFNDKQHYEMREIWNDIADGYIPGHRSSNLTYIEKVRLEKELQRSWREGAIQKKYIKRGSRVPLRQKYFDYHRLLCKKNGSAWIPKCDICEFSFKSSQKEYLSGFDVAHRKPIYEGERETRISDLSLFCKICHGLYTYQENRYRQIGQAVNYKLIIETVKYLISRDK